MQVGIGETDDLSEIDKAAKALKDEALGNPFAGGKVPPGGGGGGGPGAGGLVFPADRVAVGAAKEPQRAEIEAIKEEWPNAVREPGEKKAGAA